MKHPLVVRAMVGALSVVLVTSSAYARTPNDLRDLVDVRASSGERELKDRGYRLADTSRQGNAIYNAWWNGSDERCVLVETADGRFQDIRTAPASDCNQHENGGGKGNDKADAAVAALAIGAVVAAAVAAKNHHDKDDRYGSSFSPERGVKCYRSSRTCHGPVGDMYNYVWTTREFGR